MSSSVDPLLARQPEQPPPPPGYDWRWATRILGQFFVSLGVLLLLLIAFLEWGTNLQQHRAQSDLRRKFAAATASATTLAPLTSSTTAAAPSSTAATGASSTTAGAPPTTVAAPTTALAPEHPVSVREGQPLATIEIPRIGVKQVVVSGVDGNDLRVGPGHFRTTPQPGQAGNVAIAGHRTTYGAPFADLDQVKQGDQIVITTLANRRYVYVVTQPPFEVSPNDVSVLDQGPDPVLTLVTCTPKFTASRRLIVRGRLDTSASAPVAPAPPTTASTGGPASTSAAGSATTSPPAGAAVTPTTLPSEGDQGGNEGLVAGWGHDRAAWLQVMLWGLACSVVAVGAWTISRKRHDNWTGAMVGLLPFVVSLWFFYENVARLLPPNL